MMETGLFVRKAQQSDIPAILEIEWECFREDSDFTNWWQGTLNEATSNRFTIQCTGEYLVFLASM